MDITKLRKDVSVICVVQNVINNYISHEDVPYTVYLDTTISISLSGMVNIE